MEMLFGVVVLVVFIVVEEVAEGLNEAAQNWGVKVLRYEITEIRPVKEV